MVRLASAHFTDYKRFTDLMVEGLPVTARLVVLTGPNGCGKSSFFDGLGLWHGANGSATGHSWDQSYGAKAGTDPKSWPQYVDVQLHGGMPVGQDDKKRLVYQRSAFRNEAAFTMDQIKNLPSVLDSRRRVNRMIDDDASVSDNFQRLIMSTLAGIYDSSISDLATKKELRERIIGKIQVSLRNVFPDLCLTGLSGTGGSPLGGGTFYFSKGSSSDFLYKNLSAGEKAVFDLILDTVIKSESYNDSLWCIDEPEAHLHTRVQGLLLAELLELLPDSCQLFLATHSLGFMRKAWEMANADPAAVCFLNFQEHDFDEPTIIKPTQPSRSFWRNTLEVALDDLAYLVAPEHVVLCEGRPPRGSIDQKSEFDAKCYRVIFAAEKPSTDFMSVGNSSDVGSDRLELGAAIQTLASGTIISKIVDGDINSEEERITLAKNGVRVLSRRHLESYLLDDEVIEALCHSINQPEKLADALQIKTNQLNANLARDRDGDDVKAAAGPIYHELRRLLSLRRSGSTWMAFALGTLAPLVRPGMAVYEELKTDIFG